MLIESTTRSPSRFFRFFGQSPVSRAKLLNIVKRRTLNKLADIRSGNLYHVSVLAR